MSLSFEESLKNIVSVETVSNNVKIADEPLMTLDENNGFAVYSGDDGSWQRHSDYVYYYSFSDDNICNIDDERNISLNRKQFNITQEEK